MLWANFPLSQKSWGFSKFIQMNGVEESGFRGSYSWPWAVSQLRLAMSMREWYSSLAKIKWCVDLIGLAIWHVYKTICIMLSIFVQSCFVFFVLCYPYPCLSKMYATYLFIYLFIYLYICLWIRNHQHLFMIPTSMPNFLGFSSGGSFLSPQKSSKGEMWMFPKIMVPPNHPF